MKPIVPSADSKNISAILRSAQSAFVRVGVLRPDHAFDDGRAHRALVVQLDLIAHRARLARAPIHIATPARTPIPASQATRPSATGAGSTEAEAARIGFGLHALDVGDDVLLLVGRQLPVTEDGHVPGPVSIAS